MRDMNAELLSENPSEDLRAHDDAAPSPPPRKQSARFLALYALASAGGAAAYAPFLTLLLPARVAQMSPGNAVQVLSYTAFLGALAASVSAVVFGWASDRTRGRRGWIVAGLALSGLLLVSMQWIRTVPHLLVAICAWQVALNMMLAPLAAWAGDTVPDEQKGLLGGLLSLSPSAGALVGAVVTLPGLANGDDRLGLIGAIVAAMVLPAVLLGAPRAMPHLLPPRENDEQAGTGPEDPTNSAVWRMWLARLLMQVSEAALFAFLFVWLRDLDPAVSDSRTATIFTGVTLAAVPIAIGAGRWSDRHDKPMTPLVVASLCGAAGLVLMSLARDASEGTASYIMFGMAAGVFLALHTGQTLRVLPRARHRGRDLGYFNLTNTIPSLVMPAFALTLVPAFGFAGLFILLAILAVASAFMLPRAPRGHGGAKQAR